MIVVVVVTEVDVDVEIMATTEAGVQNHRHLPGVFHFHVLYILFKFRFLL
jgi:hypothetical protein